MRIIAGKWRGRRIAAPAGERTRPILDRAKTVLFDMLGSRLGEPGRLPAVAVLDLFAGSGALGLEALSRGANSCVFVERDPVAAKLLRHNLEALGAGSEAEVVQADATTWALTPPPAANVGKLVYELVFVDPPYRMLSGPRPDAGLGGLFRRLATDSRVGTEAIVVLRYPRRAGLEVDVSPLAEVARREVGTMVLSLIARQCRSTTEDGE